MTTIDITAYTTVQRLYRPQLTAKNLHRSITAKGEREQSQLAQRSGKKKDHRLPTSLLYDSLYVGRLEKHKERYIHYLKPRIVLPRFAQDEIDRKQAMEAKKNDKSFRWKYGSKSLLARMSKNRD